MWQMPELMMFQALLLELVGHWRLQLPQGSQLPLELWLRRGLQFPQVVRFCMLLIVEAIQFQFLVLGWVAR